MVGRGFFELQPPRNARKLEKCDVKFLSSDNMCALLIVDQEKIKR